MDTVPLCVGARPVRRGDWIYPADRETALGADDRAGATAVLYAALETVRRGLPHPPLTFLWTVQEEVGLCGARHVGLGMLGRPSLAFNFDGSSPENVTVGSDRRIPDGNSRPWNRQPCGCCPGSGGECHRDILLGDCRSSPHGLARAGGKGRLSRDQQRRCDSRRRCHQRGDARGRGPCRSPHHSPKFRARIVQAVEKAFQDAARAVRNAEGRHGAVEIEGRLDYEAFRLAENEPCVLAALAAVRAAGGNPQRAISERGTRRQLDDRPWDSHGNPGRRHGQRPHDGRTTGSGAVPHGLPDCAEPGIGQPWILTTKSASVSASPSGRW